VKSKESKVPLPSSPPGEVPVQGCFNRKPWVGGERAGLGPERNGERFPKQTLVDGEDLDDFLGWILLRSILGYKCLNWLIRKG